MIGATVAGPGEWDKALSLLATFSDPVRAKEMHDQLSQAQAALDEKAETLLEREAAIKEAEQALGVSRDDLRKGAAEVAYARKTAEAAQAKADAAVASAGQAREVVARRDAELAVDAIALDRAHKEVAAQAAGFDAREKKVSAREAAVAEGERSLSERQAKLTAALAA
jgi:hypothetical protein